MAACSFGASSLRIYKGPARIESSANSLKSFSGVRLSNSPKFDGLVLSQSSGKACLCLPAKNAQSGTDLEDIPVVKKSSESTSQLTPNASDVESLLAGICDTTSIAEVDMKLGGFRLYIRRNLAGESTISPPPVTSPVISEPMKATGQNGSASSASLAITRGLPTSGGGIQTFLDTAADSGLVIIQSPRVGHFKKCRTIKGKQGPPMCKERQFVKEGQVICYVEQLGGELPIESDVDGEIVRILHEHGDPVGYNDALIAILPSFPGIKKL